MEKYVSTRRVFLQKGMALLAVGATIPTFLDQTVMALSNPEDVKRTQQASGKDGKILVVVQLSGGNDGLSMVVPYADDAYHRARARIGIAADKVLKINNYIGLHPNLGPMKKMFDDGTMAVVQGVGYPNPNRSHFRSMDIWQSGQPERDVATSGWLGRYFDNTCPGCDPHVGVAMGETLPLAMQGERVMPLSFERPESYRYNGRDTQHYLALNQSKDAAPPTTAPSAAAKIVRPAKKEITTAASQLDFLHRTAMDAQLSSEEILRITRGHSGPTPYPTNEFGNGLKTIAAMIAGGLPTRVYYVSLGGFDTHANQLNRHDQLMTQLAQGVSAFWADLKAQKNDDRVLMMTFSEFGRRVQENASGGTDHGAAAPMFLLGKGIQQGVMGNHPSLTQLDQGDLRYNTDFRSVYATILQSWLETPSKPILGQQFPLLPVLKA
ncbi:MAG TPA: DUF1501 domain-containing protein [Dehalococcoidia bacterium]|nr:DUF1501 domain-containing protein [Dehalococcoidia bacterium]